MQNLMKKYCAKNKLTTEQTDITNEGEPQGENLEVVTFENKYDMAKRLRKVNFEVLA